MKKKLNLTKIIWICAAAVPVVIGILCIAVPEKPGIDIYMPAQDLCGAVLFTPIRIQSEKINYSADEEIILNASCGFYKPPNGRGAGHLYFHIACNTYVDVSINVGTLSEYPRTNEDFYYAAPRYASPGPDNLYYYETEDFDSTLFIMKRGFFGQLDKDSLRYPFTVTLKAKPDAPKSFSGSVFVQVSDDRGGKSYISVKFLKEGDTITLLSN